MQCEHRLIRQLRFSDHSYKEPVWNSALQMSGCDLWECTGFIPDPLQFSLARIGAGFGSA